MARLSRFCDDYQVLLDTIFGEAGDEGEKCQRAVAWVIKNRTEINRSYWGGNKIADVCQRPYMFNCWKPENYIQMRNRLSDDAQARIKYNSINSWLPFVYLHTDPTGGADYYNNTAKEEYPPWTERCQPLKKIGNFQFYKGP